MTIRPPDTGAVSARLLLVTSSLEGGGAERVLSDMANYWARLGHDVTVATWSGRGTPDFYDLESTVTRAWLDVPAAGGAAAGRLVSNLRRIRKLRLMIRDHQPDAILSFLDWSNTLTILAAIGSHRRVVVSERVHPAHYTGLGTAWRVLRWLTYRHADLVVAQTREAAAWIAARYGSGVAVIPNPLRPLPELVAEREHTILAVGRLYRQKGFDILLRAFATVRGAHPDWSLVIVGAGPEEPPLRRLIEQLALGDAVTILPPRKDVETLMARAGLVVQPSRFEGFPNVLLEAMGMGAAVVAARCPSGPAEIIDDGTNGRLVPPEDPARLAEVIGELLADPDQRRRLGESARRVRERYDQQRIMHRWTQCMLEPSIQTAFGGEPGEDR